MHRSEGCLRIFRRAREVAAAARSDRLLWQHLLSALLQQDSAEAAACQFTDLQEAELEVPHLCAALCKAVPKAGHADGPWGHAGPAPALFKS